MPTLAQVLSGGLLQRYREHRANTEVSRRTDADYFVVDINKTATYKYKHARNMIPTLMKSSILALLCGDAAEDCLLTPSEMTAIHGLDIPEAVFRRLTLRQAGALVGNSMHVAQIGAFVQGMLATRTWSKDQ